MHNLELRVDAGTEATADQLDQQVKSLYRDLRTLGVLRVERKQVEAPTGSMASVGYELGVLVISGAFSAAAMKAVSNVLAAYVNRSKARAVEWEFDGNKGSFNALSAKGQQTLVDAVAARIAADVDGRRSDGEPGDDSGRTAVRTAGSD